jgi:pilus assembly protein FimV
MFKRNYRPALLLLALLSPIVSHALGLGEIHLKSSLNAPLDADIDLVGASADDLAGLKASLADRDAFTRGGLDYPSFLGPLSFMVEKLSDGRSVLHVHSTNAANEPFATLLVTVDWPRGHVVREYTVLLDPPVFSAETPGRAAVAAPSAGSTAQSATIERRAAAPAPAPAPLAQPQPSPAPPPAATPAPPAAAVSAAPAPIASPSHAAGGSYTVRPGDTLSEVASRTYPGSERHLRERQLVAIYRANPASFQGNMNLLLSGSRLALPGDADIQAISPGEASSEVRRQYEAWAAAHGAASAPSHAGSGEAASGQLHLVPPQQAAKAPSAATSGASPAPAVPPPSAPGPSNTAANAAAAAAAAAAASADALNQKVQQLEKELAESQRQLQMRNDALAALQARAAASPAPAAAPAPTAAPAAPAAPVSSAPPAAAPSQTPAPSAAAPENKPAPLPAPSSSGTESGNSILDLIEQYWYVPAGLLAVLIILVVLRFVRARQEDEFDRSLGRLQPSFENADGARSSDTVPVRTLPSAHPEMSYHVEETGSHDTPGVAPASAAALSITAGANHQVPIDDTLTSERPVALDPGDPLAEADFHMAYGLYDQAADLVQIAIAREPNRRELKLKLLEVFFVWGNKDRFLQTARELAASRAQALAGEWEKMVIMGRQIAPDDPLFAHSGALTGAASGGVDLNLEGGQNRVDFDLLGEPSVGSGSTGVGLDLDLGAALGDSDPTGEVNKVGETGVDFVLDDPERGNDATGSTREMPGAPTRELPTLPGAGTDHTATLRISQSALEQAALDAEAPTVEQPQMRPGDHPTIREKIGAAARGEIAKTEKSDQTAELALDDLGLDLGALEGIGDETGITGVGEAPTMLSNLDEDTRELLARARAESAHADGTPRAPAADAPSDSGTWLFTDTDFAAGMPDLSDHALDSAAANAVTQVAPKPGIEVDTGQTTSKLAALDPSAVDLDVGTGTHEALVNGIDLDVGTPSVTEGTFIQTQKIATGDMALPELEPATMSEVGTKLDLARAYMDMGDPEGARSILTEVLTEGSVSQKQEARRLMDTLPG